MILNGKTTNPGELRTKITLESPVGARNAGGAQYKTYANEGIILAKWVNAHGPEAIVDGALQGLKRATVTIRYHNRITAAWAVNKGGERYEIIVPPDDIQERHEYMEFQVQLMKASA
jgi:SPP1 family predicted phage head-tail adaptor